MHWNYEEEEAIMKKQLSYVSYCKTNIPYIEGNKMYVHNQ